MDCQLDGERHQTNIRTNSPHHQGKTPIRICILGGGFGGLYTALSLRRFPLLQSENYQITLIEQRDRFLFSPLLYELVTGELQAWEIAPSYEQLLGSTNIQFYQQTIQGVDLATRQVTLSDSECLTYDYLVLAVGGETQLTSVPGATDYAYPFRSLADAERLQKQLQLLEASQKKQIRVAIVGGGPSGVELAGKLADRLQARGRVLLLERGTTILKNFSVPMQAAVYRTLKARRVRVDLETNITAIGPHQIALVQQGQVNTLAVDLVLWTAGTQPIEWVRTLACQHNSQGRLLTRPTLQLADYPEVFALGDLAEIQNPQGRSVPATAQAAYQQADCAAHNLWATVTGRPLRRFRYLHLGDMLTLGTKTAVVSSFGLQIEGPLACVIRRLVYLQRLPTLRHRLHVVRHWLTNFQRRLAKLVLRMLSGRQRRAANYPKRAKF